MSETKNYEINIDPALLNFTVQAENYDDAERQMIEAVLTQSQINDQ
jgi:hypothetical protein